MSEILNTKGYPEGTYKIPAATAIGPEVSSSDPTLDNLVILTAGTTVTTLEEYHDGVSEDVLAKHGLVTGGAVPLNYVIKSVYGAGFSKIQLSAIAQGTILSPVYKRNYTDSPESGIYK